jgi:TetR/AcrR family transcriptional repressor of bet genes
MVQTDQKMDKPVRRKASKEVRRRQLIEATIASIAERGYSATTMADVADGAGLSRGIVNFHFESKEKLLAETLRFMAKTYEAHWRNALEAADPDPATQMWALIKSDFDRAVCNRSQIAAWFALRAEAQSRPTYRRIASGPDDAFAGALTALCGDLIAEGGYDADAEKLAAGLDAMLEGMWLSILMEPDRMSAKRGHASVAEYLACIFPKHFTRNGPLGVGGG